LLFEWDSLGRYFFSDPLNNYQRIGDRQLNSFKFFSTLFLLF